jgi:hypothetical protein
MPVQKGKKRKRPRRRGSPLDAESEQPVMAQERRPTRAATRRRGWQPPLAFNVIFGVVMIAIGVFFFFIPQKGMGAEGRLLLLILYLGLGGLSLWRAYRQYQEKQQK